MAILVGTASWTDPTLLACGRFYPPHVRTPEARLRHYASCFPIVEADSPYYGLPPPAMAHAWAVRTPPGFVFNVKAFRLFTGHPAGLAALPADLRRELPPMPAGRVFYPDLPARIRRELWRRYLEGIEPLRQAGKLGAILFQFAPWVRNDAAGRALVEHCAQMAEGCLVAAEFRHASWLRGAPAAQTLALLRALGMAHTVVDSPQGFVNTVPPVWEASRDDLSLVRLHGRNAAAWNNRHGASSSRFTYEYSQDELAELAHRIRDLARRTRDTHVILNTNYEDQGMRNAQALVRALDRSAPTLPKG